MTEPLPRSARPAIPMLIQPGPWILDLLNQASLEELSVKLVQNPLERPCLHIEGRGFLFGDKLAGGVCLNDLALSVTVPARAPDLMRLDLSTFQKAYGRIEHVSFHISQNWVNKVLRTVSPQIASALTDVRITFVESDAQKLTLTASIMGLPVAVDLSLGTRGNLLYMKIDGIRLVKVLPLLSVPGLKGKILKEMKKGLPTPLVRMNEQEIFIDVLSVVPMPIDLRWKKFHTAAGAIVVEGGTDDI